MSGPVRAPGPDDPREDGRAADGGPEGHPLPEDSRGGEQGEDRIEVDVVRRGDVPELFHDVVPGDETHQGRHESEEKDVPQTAV